MAKVKGIAKVNLIVGGEVKPEGSEVELEKEVFDQAVKSRKVIKASTKKSEAAE